jgi:hypothetical protein
MTRKQLNNLNKTQDVPENLDGMSRKHPRGKVSISLLIQGL